MTFSSEQAGPMVQMIFVFLIIYTTNLSAGAAPTCPADRRDGIESVYGEGN